MKNSSLVPRASYLRRYKKGKKPSERGWKNSIQTLLIMQKLFYFFIFSCISILPTISIIEAQLLETNLLCERQTLIDFYAYIITTGLVIPHHPGELQFKF